MKELFSKEKWKFFFYTITHPMEGFYDIRHYEKGSLPIAILLVIAFSFCFSMNRISASFVVNDVDARDVDAFSELLSVLLLFVLICVGNWSITCLMEGDGRMKDIAIAVGYSLFPATFCFVIGTIFSKTVARDEEAFYYMIIGIGIAYTLLMMLIGIMQVHNYTLAKTLLTIFLTFIAMLIMIFLSLLLFDLISQVANFFKSIYQEIIFRT